MLITCLILCVVFLSQHACAADTQLSDFDWLDDPISHPISPAFSDSDELICSRSSFKRTHHQELKETLEQIEANISHIETASTQLANALAISIQTSNILLESHKSLKLMLEQCIHELGSLRSILDTRQRMQDFLQAQAHTFLQASHEVASSTNADVISSSESEDSDSEYNPDNSEPSDSEERQSIQETLEPWKRIYKTVHASRTLGDALNILNTYIDRVKEESDQKLVHQAYLLKAGMFIKFRPTSDWTPTIKQAVKENLSKVDERMLYPRSLHLYRAYKKMIKSKQADHGKTKRARRS